MNLPDDFKVNQDGRIILWTDLKRMFNPYLTVILFFVTPAIVAQQLNIYCGIFVFLMPYLVLGYIALIAGFPETESTSLKIRRAILWLPARFSFTVYKSLRS